MLRSRVVLLFAVLLLTVGCGGSSKLLAPAADSLRLDRAFAQDASARISYSRLPLQFVANVGQVDPKARYVARGHGQ